MPPPEPSLLFLNQHYWPHLAATAQHLTDLAEYLAADGFEVGVLSGTGGYAGRERSAPRREERRGVALRRIATPGLGRSSHAGRALDYAAFHLGAGWRTARGAGPDLAISLTTPSMLPVTVALAARRRGIPFGIWAMDLHPEVEERLGVLPRPMAAPLRRASRWAFREADFVVALGPAMEERLRAKGVPEDRLHRIPVWNRADEVWPVPREENPLRSELGLEDAFVVMYAGNAGLAHRFEEVVEAMDRLGDEPGLAFVFVGDGPRRAEIEAAVRERAIPGFRYLDYFPRHRLHESLSLADVHLLTLRRDMAGLAAPSKLQGILAAGRPALMVGPADSDPGIVIRSEAVGAVIEPGEDAARGGEELAEEILRLRRDEARRRELGERGRAVFEARYTREVCCGRWAELIRDRGRRAAEGPGR